MPVAGAGGQQHGLGLESPSARQNADRVARADLHHFLTLKDVRVLQRVGCHEVHQGLASHLGEARVVLHHRGGGDLTSKGSPFDDDGTQSAARSVNAGREAGRPAADDHQVRLDLLGVAVGNENRLLFHFVEGKHE